MNNVEIDSVKPETDLKAETESAALNPAKAASKSKFILMVALVSGIITAATACSAVITWVATRDECHSFYTYHDPNTGAPDIAKMVQVMERVDVNAEDLMTYFSSFSETNSSHPTSGRAPSSPPSSPLHSRALALAPASDSRRLSTLGNLVTIGHMVGDVWNLVKANTATTNYGPAWIGAVPSNYATDWSTFTGWQTYTIQPQGNDKPSCDSSWGNTYADWTLTWEGNGNYIKNGKILASATAAWGMHVNVDVTPGTSPVNVGTADSPVAQLQFSVSFQSQGGMASTYTESVIVSFDANGHWDITATNGAFC